MSNTGFGRVSADNAVLVLIDYVTELMLGCQSAEYHGVMADLTNNFKGGASEQQQALRPIQQW